MRFSQRCILSFMFIGNFIVGVNRDLANASAVYRTVYSGKSLRAETLKIIDFERQSSPFLLSNAEQKSVSSRLLRRKRSISSKSESLCSPWDSCQSRCGREPRGLPYTCNCDSKCTFFKDCCSDYEAKCGLKDLSGADSSKYVSGTTPTCELLFEQYPALTVSKCSEKWNYTSQDQELCSAKISELCIPYFNLENSEAADVYFSCKSSVRKKCLEKMSSKCDIKVEPRCASVAAKKCYKLSSMACARCDISFWPVITSDGLLYKNSHCAICNFQGNYTSLRPQDFIEELRVIDRSIINEQTYPKFPLRHCVPSVIGECLKKLRSDNVLAASCANHSGPVVAESAENGDKYYKNIYCAMCNDERLDELECPTWSLNASKEAHLLQSLIRPLIGDFVTGDIDGIKLDDIPAAFSILLNFGLDGRDRMYFSSEGEEEMKRNQKHCGKGYIWDPFSELCRKLYCSTEFVLVDYRCVKKETSAENNVSRNETTLIPDAEAEFVHLSLSAEMEIMDFLQFNEQDIDMICKIIRESLSQSFNIKIERIKNVSFNISLGNFSGLNETLRFIENEMEDSHPITFIMDFDLYEDLHVDDNKTEPTVDSIVSMLASALSVNGFEFDINNVSSRIFEIHQTVSILKSWCSPEEGGEQKEYWNSDFSLVLDNSTSSVLGYQIKGIYVNKTGKFYPRGKFVADILFQGYQFSSSLINVSGVAVVCDWKAKLNESCLRIVLEKDEYDILDNNTLVIHSSKREGMVVDSTVYEKGENDTIYVCLNGLPHTIDDNYRLDMDITQAYVSYVLCWVSIVAMAIVLVTYTTFPSLRNLPGCNVMNLTFSLMVMQIIFVFGQRQTVKGMMCKVVAHLLHYQIICCFMWMNVMAYDLYKTFGNKTMLSNIRSKGKYLPRYMAYAYIAPLSIILIGSLLDYFLTGSVYAPHYGRGVCWITSKLAAIIFFAVPLAIIMTINLSLYVITIHTIRNVKLVLYFSNQKNNQKGMSDVFLYARMASVVGLTWALAFAAAYVKEEKIVGQVLTYLFIIFNTLQGLFILFAFVCNRRVWDLYGEAFRSLFHRVFECSKQKCSAAVISRANNEMKRTVSSDTVVSTLSNSSTISNDSRLKTIKESE